MLNFNEKKNVWNEKCLNFNEKKNVCRSVSADEKSTSFSKYRIEKKDVRDVLNDLDCCNSYEYSGAVGAICCTCQYNNKIASVLAALAILIVLEQ